MNYYPNYNPNYYNPSYSYNIPYNQNVQPQQAQTQTLNGKIVDSKDIVKVTDVPIGSYGIFPKADLSEIYIKSWNNNGTTNIITLAEMVLGGLSFYSYSHFADGAEMASDMAAMVQVL